MIQLFIIFRLPFIRFYSYYFTVLSEVQSNTIYTLSRIDSHRNHNHQILRIVHHQTKHFKVNSFNLVILFKLICEVVVGYIVFPDFLWTNLVREFNSSWALFCPLESLFLLKLSLFVEPVMIFQNRTKTSALENAPFRFYDYIIHFQWKEMPHPHIVHMYIYVYV